MNIFKIKCSFLFWITSFLCLLAGLFQDFCLLMSLIIVHECGHMMVAYLLKWNVKKIMIYPFGGVTLFEEKLNRPMKEELLILLAGPLFQIFYFSLLTSFFSLPSSFSFYHYALLYFNFLPIYPLDGGRILFLFFQTLFPYFKSHKMMIFSSLFLLIFFLFRCSIFHPSLFFFLYFFFLCFKVLEEKKQERMIFEKFLLERILYSFSFPFQKKINGPSVEKMYRDCEHSFFIKNKWVKERDILRKRFDL